MNGRMNTRRRRLILTGLALGASAISWAAVLAGDSPEAREVKERFARQVGRIRSLEASFAHDEERPEAGAAPRPAGLPEPALLAQGRLDRSIQR